MNAVNVDLQKLKALLLCYGDDAVAQRCLTVLGDATNKFYPSTRPMSVQRTLDVYTTRAMMNRKRGGSIKGYDGLIPALEAMEGGIGQHCVVTPEEWFLVFTDEAMTVLAGILTVRLDQLFRYYENKAELDHP